MAVHEILEEREYPAAGVHLPGAGCPGIRRWRARIALPMGLVAVFDGFFIHFFSADFSHVLELSISGRR